MGEITDAPVQEQPKLSVDDFAAKIKAKYPDYASIDNAELVKKIVAKYPDYNSQIDYSQKKSPVGNALPNGADLSGSGLNPFQNTQQHSSGVFMPGQEPAQPTQPQQEPWVKSGQSAMQNYWKQLSPDEQKALTQQTQQSVASHANETISETPQSQQGDYAYAQTLPGKIQNGLTYLAQKATKGGLQVVKGAAYLAQLTANSQRGLGLTDTHDFDQAFNSADKATDFLSKTSENQVEKSKTMANLGGLAEFLPAAAAAEGTGGATLYLQGMGQGKEIMDKAEENGAKINPVVKTAFILGTGGVNGLLMGDLGHGIFNSLSSSLKDDVVKNITMNAIKEAAGKDITAEGFTDLLKQGAKDWGDKALQGGVNFLKNTKKAVTDLSALNVSNFALKKGVDLANDQPVFNESLGTLADQEGETLKAAPLFGAVGSLGDISKLTPLSEYKNVVLDNLIKDSSDANVAKTKQFISENGQQVGWTPEEIAATNDHVDKLAAITKSIPKGLPEEKATKAVDLIIGRDNLQKQLDEQQAYRTGLTAPFNEEPSPGEQLLQNKIDQANDKLRTLATGKRSTYSKGTEEDEGTFYKTVNGVKEEIPQDRYDLETLERPSKNEQPQPNQEVPAQTPEQPTAEDNKVADVPVNEEPANNPVATTDPLRQKAIDAITHGIIVPENFKENDPSARIDLGMSSADKRKAVSDISKGNYETAPAKRLLDKVMEMDKNDDYPIIEGLGGSSIRRQGLTSEDIQNHINDAKSNKIGELSPRQIEEHNQAATELGITPEDAKRYEEYQQSGRSDQAGTPEVPTGLVSEPENDTSTGEPQDTGNKTPQREPSDPTGVEPTVSSKKESLREQADKVDITLGDNKGGVRTREIVEAEADAKLKDGYDIHDLVHKIKTEKHVATDTENAILAKYVGAKTDEIIEINKRLQDEGATLSDKTLDELTAKRDAALNDFQDVADANDQTRSDAGRALNSGKFKLNNNYSLENMIVRERDIKGDKLTPEELADVTKKYQSLEQANKDYEQKLKESQAEIARLKAEKAIKRMPRTKAKTHAEFVEERKKIAEDFSNKLKAMRTNGQLNDVVSASAQFLSAAAPYVAKMVTSLAREGITELGEVVRRIKDELELNDISDKDMHDLISGKYNAPATKSELQDKIRILKNEAKLLSQIEDAENGLRKLPEAKKIAANEKIDGLRKRLKELDKENGYYEEQNERATKTQLQKSIEEFQGKIDRKEFDKPEKTLPPEESQEVRDLRRKRDELRYEYELDVARRELDKRSKIEKTKDVLLNVASLPRAIKATLDFSAVLRQGLIPTVAHPMEAIKALKTMFGQTFSEKKYRDWFSDIKTSPQYDLMKQSGLYISEKNNPELLAREEQFTSNLLEKIPVLGKVHQGAERAYTGYLNAIRTGVFVSEAIKLQERGYTFKNNPDAFRDLATVVNVLSGRGSIPDWLGGKQPAILSNLLFSPRFMAARIQTLYLWGDPRLSRSAKVLAAKDIGKTLATAAVILGMAKAAGLSVSTDPRGSDFLKIKDGDTRYDILGGLTQYVVFLSQQITGQKVPAGATKPNSLTSGKFGKPTRFDAAISFLRGKLNPIVGSSANLMAGKDMVGQPYHLWPNVPQEFIPLPATDLYDAYKVGGITNSLKVLIPSQFGIGVSSFTNKKAKPKTEQRAL